MFLATEVADSLEYYLTAEKKQTILSFVDGKDVFTPSAYCLRPHRTTKTLRKSSTATSHTLRNNCAIAPDPSWEGLSVRKGTGAGNTYRLI